MGRKRGSFKGGFKSFDQQKAVFANIFKGDKNKGKPTKVDTNNVNNMQIEDLKHAKIDHPKQDAFRFDGYVFKKANPKQAKNEQITDFMNQNRLSYYHHLGEPVTTFDQVIQARSAEEIFNDFDVKSVFSLDDWTPENTPLEMDAPALSVVAYNLFGDDAFHISETQFEGASKNVYSLKPEYAEKTKIQAMRIAKAGGPIRAEFLREGKTSRITVVYKKKAPEEASLVVNVGTAKVAEGVRPEYESGAKTTESSGISLPPKTSTSVTVSLPKTKEQKRDGLTASEAENRAKVAEQKFLKANEELKRIVVGSAKQTDARMKLLSKVASGDGEVTPKQLEEANWTPEEFDAQVEKLSDVREAMAAAKEAKQVADEFKTTAEKRKTAKPFEDVLGKSDTQLQLEAAKGRLEEKKKKEKSVRGRIKKRRETVKAKRVKTRAEIKAEMAELEKEIKEEDQEARIRKAAEIRVEKRRREARTPAEDVDEIAGRQEAAFRALGLDEEEEDLPPEIPQTQRDPEPDQRGLRMKHQTKKEKRRDAFVKGVITKKKKEMAVRFPPPEEDE